MRVGILLLPQLYMMVGILLLTQFYQPSHITG
jgi:hypothetical protein